MVSGDVTSKGRFGIDQEKFYKESYVNQVFGRTSRFSYSLKVKLLCNVSQGREYQIPYETGSRML